MNQGFKFSGKKATILRGFVAIITFITIYSSPFLPLKNLDFYKSITLADTLKTLKKN